MVEFAIRQRHGLVRSNTAMGWRDVPADEHWRRRSSKSDGRFVVQRRARTHRGPVVTL